MDLSKARSRLLMIWICGFVPLIIILLIQTLNGSYEITTETGEVNQAQKVWAWLIPLVFPTLTLMISVMGTAAMTEDGTTVKVKKEFFRLVCILSLAYLALLVSLLLFWPVFKSENPLDTFSLSNYLLGPLQGLVIGALGYLFSAKVKDQKAGA